MNSSKRRFTLAGVGLAAVAVAALLLAGPFGCRRKCKNLEEQYRQALQDQRAFAADRLPSSTERLDEDTPLDLVGSLSMGYLNRATDRAMRKWVKSALETVETIDVAGVKPVSVSVEPDLADIDIKTASDVCDHCFRVRATLDGRAGVDVPVLGERQADLNGTLNLVVPLILGPAEHAEDTQKAKIDAGNGGGEPNDGEQTENVVGALKFDFGRLLQEGKPLAIEGLEGLPGTWSRVLRGALESRLSSMLLENLPPIAIANFETPNVGLDGFELAPVGLAVDPANDRIIAGFRTNLPIEGTSLSKFRNQLPRRDAEDRPVDVSFALPAALVPAAVRAGIRTESIPRRYTTAGIASESGALRPMPLDLVLGTPHAPKDRKNAGKTSVELPMDFNFRTWRLPTNGVCLTLHGRAQLRLVAEDTTLAVRVDEVSFDETSGSDLALKVANWRSNRMLEAGEQVLRESLAEHNLAIPGGPWTFESVTLKTGDGIAAAGFRLKPGEKEKGEQSEN